MDDIARRRVALGRKIRTRRIAAGHSQVTFADMVGTSQSYLWKLEAGRVNVSIGALCRVADALGVRVADLIEF